MARTNSFVDPNTLALPSPSASPSPSPSTSSLPPVTPSSSKRSTPPHSSDSAPPRKRSRTELTPEERKEARAHRNRIAAQNSRDKRKAQFAALEARIADLAAENRALREGMGIAALRESAEQRAMEDARERENRELRERVRTLESGWDAIVKALQTHGLPPGISSAFALPQSGESLSSSAPTPTPAPFTQSNVSPTQHSTAFPVFIPPAPVFPISPAPSLAQSSPSPSLVDVHEPEQHESTRHLAAGGLVAIDLNLDMAGLFDLGAHAPDGQHLGQAPPTPLGDVDEKIMDDLLREILAPSPGLSSTPLPSTDAQSMSLRERHGAARFEGSEGNVWAGDAAEAEREMQKLLDSLPANTAGLGLEMPMGGDGDISPTLEFEMEFEDHEMGAWERAPASVFRV